jgi:hypothetical protein
LDLLANKAKPPKKKPQLLGLFQFKGRSALLAAAALAFTVFAFFHGSSFEVGLQS